MQFGPDSPLAPENVAIDSRRTISSKEGEAVHPKGKYRRDDAIDYDQDRCRFRSFGAMYEWNYFNEEEERHPLTDANVLYDAFVAARKGSHWKTQVQRFRWNALREIGKLQDELTAMWKGEPGAYELSPYSRFEVNERGKRRAITALGMRDRVVKHALNDNFLIPHIRPHLIYDNGASLKGKGVSFTRNRLIAHLEKFYRKYGDNDGYIMIMDFSGYYDNIDHRTAMQMIRKYEPDEFARRLTKQAYDSYRVDVSDLPVEEYERVKNGKFSMVEYRRREHRMGGMRYLYKSLSVGDQTSQITAIAFPTPIDKIVTIVSGNGLYARYMDDIYVIARTKEELNAIQKRIEHTAERLKLIINPRKTKIGRLRDTFTFMQFKYYLRENGHVVVRINPKTVTRMRRRLKRMRRQIDLGKMRFCKIQEMFRGWIANYAPLMSQKQRDGLIEIYQNLFGKGLDQWMKSKRIRSRWLTEPNSSEPETERGTSSVKVS